MSDKAIFFPNGNTAFFRDGKQVPLLQEPWFMLYVRMIAAAEVDPTKVEFTMPDASRARVFETEDGNLNWTIEGKSTK